MRMNNLLIRLFLTFLLIASSVTVHAEPAATNFIQGVDAFQKEDFSKAVTALLSLAGSGVKNGHLFYNLGNAYLKSGDLGHAIYWYERAVPFTPRNADLRFNLDYARSLQVDDQPDKDPVLTRVLFFWKDLLATRTIQYIVLGSNVLLWLGCGLLLFRSSSTLKALIAAALTLLVLMTPTTLFQLYRTTLAPQGIILPEKAAVRSGRSSDATELFLLHAGTRVTIKEESNGYVKIRFKENMFGWITQDEVGILY